MEGYLNAGKASSYKRKKGEEKDDSMPECYTMLCLFAH
jgi:hypothetical protein